MFTRLSLLLVLGGLQHLTACLGKVKNSDTHSESINMQLHSILLTTLHLKNGPIDLSKYIFQRVLFKIYIYFRD